jgi:large subunit ribosomal protein L29
MNIADIRELTEEELTKTLTEKRQELFNLRLQSRTGQLENPAIIRQIRRDVARIKMVQAQKVN